MYRRIMKLQMISRLNAGLRIAGTVLLIAFAVDVHARAQSCIVFGDYTSNPTVAYYCAFGVVSFNYSGWRFTNPMGDTIWVTGLPSGSVPTLKGTLNCSDSTFTASASLPGSCTETYVLQGRFSS